MNDIVYQNTQMGVGGKQFGEDHIVKLEMQSKKNPVLFIRTSIDVEAGLTFATYTNR